MSGSKTMKIQKNDGPDFVGIGVQKSGTSWIGNILAQHPDVYIKKKEISFFVQNFHRGYEWYHKFFMDKGKRISGEITVSYMISPRPESTRKEFYPKKNPRRKIMFWRKQPDARDELKAHYPDLRVFAIFRNPVERAWSQYWFWRKRKERLKKNIVPFEKMFADDGRWIYSYALYADLLTYWRKAFPGMGVFFYDDLKKDPLALAKEIYRFIGVDPCFTPEVNKVINKGSYIKMDNKIRAMLVNAYAGQIKKFAEITGRDLSHWLEY